MTAPELVALEEKLRLLQLTTQAHNSAWFGPDGDGSTINSYETSMLGLTYGAPYFWSNPICQMIRDSAAKLRTPWTLLKEFVPAPQGFFYFDEPTSYYGDATGEHGPAFSSPLRGFAWTIFFQRGDLEPGLRAGQRIINRVPIHLPPQGGGSLDHAAGLMIQFYTQENQGTHLQPAGWTLWRFGRNHLELVEDELSRRAVLTDPSVAAASSGTAFADDPFLYGGNDNRVIGTCFQFLQQGILEDHKVWADRAVRRRIQREALDRITPPEHEAAVRIIKLRRVLRINAAESPDEKHDVAWTCQWLVGGHWRAQLYPSLGIHQPKFIHPYLKGPKDKPLRIAEHTLYAITR